MAAAPAAHQPLDGYQLRLPIFEGPLEVLLRLIERDQLEISEVSLLAVFDQFMSYVQAIEAAPTVVAEFAAVAGRLAVLKSRALLPKPPRPLEDGEEPDLVRQLAEYRAVRAAADMLAGRQKDGSGAFGRGNGVTKPDTVSTITSPLPATALSRALERWVTRLPAMPVLLATRPVVSLREMLARITSALDRSPMVSFHRLCASCTAREDVAVAFLALLVLMRRHVVDASQPVPFGPIAVTQVRREPTSIRGSAQMHRGSQHGHN